MSQTKQRELCNRGRLVSLVAGLSLLLALTGTGLARYQSARHASLTTAAATARPVSTDLNFLPTFRLGSAAQPFGWSTAVGDFNTDGALDLVIADHTSHRAGIYSYQLQFSVSGLGARSFAFESAHAAVTVRISDVDHDDDLDVVVNSAGSREIVGIWLNDGHGRFKSADVGRFASDSQRLTSVGATDPSVDPVACGWRSPRSPQGQGGLVHATPAISRDRPATSSRRLQALLHSPTVAPRGPPLRLT